MLEVEFDISTKEIDRILAELERRTGNLAPVMDDIGDELVHRIDLGFRDAKSPEGKPWPLLSVLSTLIREDEDGKLIRKGEKPLNDSGRLKKSITHNASIERVRIGTNVEYASTHQFGAKQGQFGTTSRGGLIPWGDIPARPFMPVEGLPDAWERDVIELVKGYFDIS